MRDQHLPYYFLIDARSATRQKPALPSMPYFQALSSNSHSFLSIFYTFSSSLSLSLSTVHLILSLHCSAATDSHSSSPSIDDDDPCPRNLATAAFFFPPDVAAGRDLTEPTAEGAGAGSKVRMKGEMISSGLGPTVVVGSRYACGKKEGGKRRREEKQEMSKYDSNKNNDILASQHRKEAPPKQTLRTSKPLPSQPNPTLTYPLRKIQILVIPNAFLRHQLTKRPGRCPTIPR